MYKFGNAGWSTIIPCVAIWQCRVLCDALTGVGRRVPTEVSKMRPLGGVSYLIEALLPMRTGAWKKHWHHNKHAQDFSLRAKIHRAPWSEANL